MNRISVQVLAMADRWRWRVAFVSVLALALAAGIAWSHSPGEQKGAKEAGQEQSSEPAPPFSALDKIIVADATKSSEIMKNLTYLSDIIGPRLTGSAALKRANDWTLEKMKEYGLTNVHLEPWTLAEGWERGHCHGRIVEPENGRTLTIASYGWTPGTNGKVVGDVVILNAKKASDLEPYKGKLKGAIVLDGAPAKLSPIAEVEKQPMFGPPRGKDEKGKFEKFNFEEFRAYRKMKNEFLAKEGVIAVFSDAGKHLGLLNMGGDAAIGDRPSASNRLPMVMVAHEHYALLHRLAQRPEPAKTRVELDISNRFIPGPIAVYNTVGEIKGSEKPDEVVVVCAHLDSWDLGQGTLDNGTGTCVVLESARLLAKCGTSPKRTIRFILFTGEEQGLLGSRAYCDKHKDELTKVSACIAHDTGTGKVLGLGWQGKRTPLKDVLTKELAVLKNLGVEEPFGASRFFGGSDHASFDRAGVPGCIFKQEIAGYRFAHHSQADTLDLAQEPALIQGAQVMSIAAMRLANMENMLPRETREASKGE